jgi:hypothetical protein
MHCMTGLLLVTRASQGRALDSMLRDSEWVLMLAMLAQDLAHPGKVNQFPAEIESHSVSEVRPLIRAAGIPELTQALIGELILMTDLVRLRPHH